ncbi:hypothetical protein ACHAW6_010675 [Cyclotella cf. meneghiniana]
MAIEQKEDTNNATTFSSTAAFQWNTLAILQSIFIFVLAGFAEIIGGWLIWAALRGVRVPDDVLAVTAETDDANNIAHDEDDANVNDPATHASQYATVKKPWYYALLGSLTLVAYGFLPCLQPSAGSSGFARIYAAYGGFFIVLSFLMGWAMEGVSAKPDVGDLVGGGIALVGAGVIMFWPRG